MPAATPWINADTIRMPAWIRWSVYGVSILLTVTGLIWLFAHFILRAPDQIAHPLEAWMLRLHGIGVMAGLFFYGSLLRPHMTKAWVTNMNRVTGVIITAVLLGLTISGYLLYYSGSEEIRPIISTTHWIIGLLLPVWLPLHIIKGRKKTAFASGKITTQYAKTIKILRDLTEQSVMLVE